MSSIVSRMRLRAKLDRPEACVPNPNSSQVRRLIVKVMQTGTAHSSRWAARSRRSLLVAVSLCIAAAGTAALMISSKRGAVAAQPVVVSTFKLQPLVPCTVPKDYVGTIVPGKKSEIGFLRAGRVSQVLVNEGDCVEAGELIAELDSSAIQAELTLARTELRLAQNDSQRSRPVYRGSRETYSSASAKLEHWTAVVERLELQLAQGQLRAPYKAIVTQTFLSDGSNVPPDRPIMKIVSCDEVVVKVSLPFLHAESLAPTVAYAITIGTRQYLGSLKALLPEVDEKEQTRAALFTVPELSPATIGAHARLHLDVPTRKLGFRIPKSAARQEENGSTTVALVRSDSGSSADLAKSKLAIAVQRPVDVLQIDEDWMVVRGDLQVNDRIVAVMPKSLQNNQRVRHSDFVQWRQEAWLNMH